MNIPTDPRTLTIDIGGSHIKATILDHEGAMQMDYERVETPVPASPENVLDAIKRLTKNFPSFDTVAAGFPGYVKNGVVKTAPNLGTDLWIDVDLASRLGEMFG